MVAHHKNGDSTGLDKCFKKAQRFSWWATTMLHRFPDLLTYDRKTHETDLANLF